MRPSNISLPGERKYLHIQWLQMRLLQPNSKSSLELVACEQTYPCTVSNKVSTAMEERPNAVHTTDLNISFLDGGESARYFIHDPVLSWSCLLDNEMNGRWDAPYKLSLQQSMVDTPTKMPLGSSGPNAWTACGSDYSSATVCVDIGLTIKFGRVQDRTSDIG